MITTAEILAARVLVVDDQPVNVALLTQMLRGAGYTAVSSTIDARMVCTLHQQNRYDLILLDLQMPVMDGFQVMEGLKAIEHDDYLSVLVVTAQPSHKLRALAEGARDFVTKPIDVAEVLMRVHNMLEVRLLHVRLKRLNAELEQTIRTVESGRDIIESQSRELRSLYDQLVTEQRLSERLRLNALPDVITVRPDEEVRSLAPGFLANRRRDVDLLTSALSRTDFDEIRRIGHCLTETGRGYGFDGVTEIGSAIERAAHHQDPDAIAARIESLAEYLQRVQVTD